MSGNRDQFTGYPMNRAARRAAKFGKPEVAFKASKKHISGRGGKPVLVYEKVHDGHEIAVDWKDGK